MRLALAACAHNSFTWFITAPRLTSWRCSLILPLVMRATSSRSSTSRVSSRTWRSTMSRMRATGGASGYRWVSSETEVRIGASGLRSSWPRLARNSSLRRAASRTWYCLLRARSVECRAVISASVRTGRSIRLRLPRPATACRTADESAPRWVSRMMGRSDQSGWRATQSCSSL